MSGERRRSRRFEVLRAIEQLDPERDHQRIIHLSLGYEFSWDSVRAFEIALYRSYCVPSISALLDRTGELHHHPQRRYDDTAILLAEICKWGYESSRGKAALERMNWVHGHFKISNDDYLYVLSTFIYEPVRWIDAFGWRPTSAHERLGYYCFWREVGVRMGIVGIPTSYDAFEAWSRAYERRHFQFAATSRRVASSTRDLFASWAPRLTRPVVRAGIYAMLDDAMLASFGFPTPPPLARRLVRGALKLRGRIVRWLPPRREAHFFIDGRIPTYADGYRISEIGPPRLIAAEQRRARESPETAPDRPDREVSERVDE